MRSERINELQVLKDNLTQDVIKILDAHHTVGYESPIWPREAVAAMQGYCTQHVALLEELDSLYSVGKDYMETEREAFFAHIEGIYEKWLEKIWVHKKEGKDALVNLIGYIIALNEGKVYINQLPRLLYLVSYDIMVKQGFALSDLIWHVKKPHYNAYQVTSRQIDFMMPLMGETFTVSNPSMRSAYIATKEKAKKFAKLLDGCYQKPISGLVKEAYDRQFAVEVKDTLPVKLWEAGYRPDGNRLMLEECIFWDRDSRFSTIPTSRPIEMFNLEKEDGVGDSEQDLP